jgi:hypothetical protein
LRDILKAVELRLDVQDIEALDTASA